MNKTSLRLEILFFFSQEKQEQGQDNSRKLLLVEQSLEGLNIWI